MNVQFKKGSEWRKWDLHVHTPASFFWKSGKIFNNMGVEEKRNSIEEFIKAVNKSDVSVFCIQDYWTFDGYLELIDYCKENPTKLKKTVFPGMELRIESPTDYRLNIHVILSNDLTKQQLNDFKSELKIRSINRKLSNESLIEFARTLDESKARIHGYGDPKDLNKEKLLELGSKTAEITKESLMKSFNQIPEGMGFIILPYDTSDGLLKLNWKVHPHDDNYFMQSANIIETRQKKNIDLFNCIKNETNKDIYDNFYKTIGCKPKPCISGSDAHKFSEYGIYPSNKITWIKADPNFEGLKQIIYEPSERVKIQEKNPKFDFDKPYFSEINISDKVKIFTDDEEKISFKKQNIQLNENLITIIGGRGTGKSLLINYFGNSFGKLTDKQFISQINKDEKFKIKYSKTSLNDENIDVFNSFDENEVEFLFISQGEFKKHINSKKLGEKIKDLLNIDKKEFLFREKVDEEINKVLFEIDSYLELFNKTNEFGDKINDEILLNENKNKYEKLLESITTKENKTNLQIYTQNVGDINKLNFKLSNFAKLKLNLTDQETDLNQIIKNFNIELKNDFKIPSINFNIQFEKIMSNMSEIKFQINEKTTENEKIKLSFESIYVGDLITLLKNAENYKNELESIKQKLNKLKSWKDELNNLKKERSQLGLKIKMELERQEDIIKEKFENLFESFESDSRHKALMEKILNDRNIKFESEILFDKKVFLSKLKECLYLQKYRDSRIGGIQDERIMKEFNINNMDSFVEFIKINLTDYIDGNKEENVLESKKNDFLNLFFDLTTRSKFLYVQPKITYNGKPINKLSDGQKGTLYLCLKLATKTFSTPIIFDQPEDDLDNGFIINDLIDIFKEIKKYRQVIIVTHNANLVVNSDAEQIIIATNDGDKLQYKSGSLESISINKDVCRILEGGEPAFNKRKEKYKFNLRQ